MIRQHMLRGFNEKVFYAVTQGVNDKIMMISFDSGKKDTLKMSEVFTLTGGRLIQFENDNEHIQDDSKKSNNA